MKFNPRILRLLTLALFLAAQWTVAMHTAEFGPEKHRHQGALCDIQFFAEHAKAGAAPVAAAPAPVVALAGPLFFSFARLAAQGDFRPALARGPPDFLFS